MDITKYRQGLHGKRNIRNKVGHDIVNHAVDQGMCFDDLLDYLWHFLQQSSRFICTRGFGDCRKRSWGVDALCKLGRSGPWVMRCHYGADDGNTIQSFSGGLALIQDPLNVGQVNSADGYSADGAARVGDGVKDGLSTCGTNDVLCIGFSNLC